jgi:TonB C terminal
LKTFYAAVIALICLAYINRFASSFAHELPESEWEEHVRCKVLNFWRPYDAEARQKLIYQIDVTPAGSIRDTKLLESSGDKLTDDTARYKLTLIPKFLGFSGSRKRTLAIRYNELPVCKDHYGKKIDRPLNPLLNTKHLKMPGKSIKLILKPISIKFTKKSDKIGEILKKRRMNALS